MANATVHPVDDIIDRQPFSRFQIRTITLCSLVGIFDGFDTQSIGFLAPPIAEYLHADIRSFGAVFSASLFGIMIGTLGGGPLGDHWGRKWLLIWPAVLFGLLSCLTPLVGSREQLIVLRFITGLGLGAAFPNMFALTCEYAPKRLSRIPICVASATMPVGAMISGFVASAIMADWGWQSVFLIGGIAPLILAVVLVVWLPESVRFLSLNPSNQERIRAIMVHIWPAAASPDVRFAPPAQTA